MVDQQEISGDSIFTENSNNIKQEEQANGHENFKCLKCHKEWQFPAMKDEYLAHLFLKHKLVIADVEDIANLQEYLKFWQVEFTDHELEEYCTTMLLDQLPDGTPAKNESYYLLSDILPKDFELRQRLRKESLERALAQHQFERTDRNFSKECLYCRDVISGLRSEYLEHLFGKHYLQLGRPENLVYIDELLSKVQSNLENLVCLYCEKIFKDRVTLKEHMRKKGHKRINPNNRMYDQYFLIHYRNERTVERKSNHAGGRLHLNNQQKKARQTVARNNGATNKTSHDNAAEPEESFAPNKLDEDSDSDWSEWDGEKMSAINCLFCPSQEPTFEAFKEHLLSSHGFDFHVATKDCNFYQKIKMVNYVRHQMHLLRCVTCDIKSENLDTLLQHLTEEKHFSLGSKARWDKPEYFFPFCEDDGLLCVLDDNPDDDVDESVVRIISEDTTAQINKDAERLSLENFKFSEIGI